jgi:hypothetical protein
MPPSRIAAPSGSPSQATPANAISATVTTIETVARRSGSSQRPSLKPTLIFSPDPNSDSRSTTSAMRSSARACVAGAMWSQSSQSGLAATPAAR